MALEPQEIEIPLTLGMDTRASGELQEPTSMRLVQNLHWRELGGIEKRPSDDTSITVAEPSGSSYDESDACGLIVREGDVCVVSGQHGVMPYSTKQGAFKYNRRTVTTSSTPSALAYCPVSYDISRRFVHSAQFNSDSRGVGSVTTSQYNGIQVMAWVEIHASVNRIHFQAIDPDTGTVLASTEYITMSNTNQYMTSCAYQEVGKEGVLIAYMDQGGLPLTVKTMRYDAASNEFVADSDLTTNAKATFFALMNLDSQVVFAFTDNTSGFLVAQQRTVGSVTTTHTGTHGADTGVCILRGATRVLIVSCVAGNAYAETFSNPADVLTLYTASSEQFMLCYSALESLVGGSGNDAVAYVSSTSTGSSPASTDGVRTKFKQVNFDAAAPTAGVSTSIPHVVPLGAFTLQGMAHLVSALYVTHSGIVTGRAVSCLVLRHRQLRHDCVSRICHDRFFASTYTYLGQLQIASVVGTNVWLLLPADPGADALPASTYLPQTIFLERISAARPMPMPYVSPTPAVAMSAGGQLWEFDGEHVYEATPLHYPRALIVDAGAGTSSGTFTVVPVWRFVDRTGRVHRIPGDSVSLATIATQQIDVYVSICPARAFNASTTGQDMEPEIYINDGTTATLYLANVSGAKDVPDSSVNDIWYKFTDVQPGSSSDPEYPFSASGEIAPEPPPPMSDVAIVVDRVVGINAEDRSEVWYSKPLVAGFGVEWSTVNKFRVEDDCTKVIAMGGGICVLARGGIYLVSGEGPNATGLGDFAPAVRLNEAVDCIDAVSVCKTPIGVVFRGRRGFYLLDNGMNAKPFAVPIDPEVLTDPALDPSTSTSYRIRVAYQEQTNEIHCLTPSGGRLVYNLLEGKWSKYATASTTHRDLAVARGKLWRLDYVSPNTILRSEKLFSEDGVSYNTETGVTWEIDTPWYRLDQVAGMVRLWRVWLNLGLTADLAGVGTITLSYYVNNSETAAQTVTWTGAELSSALSYDPATSEKIARLMFVPAQQIVHTFKLVISESHTGSSAGTKPLSLRLRFGKRPSLNKRNKLPPKG